MYTINVSARRQIDNIKSPLENVSTFSEVKF